MDNKYPLVSIITPSFNQGQYIEEAILSVKNQDYPNIEHIIMDGGSTDGTVDILRKYDKDVNWDSEPDQGVADALNKIFNRGLVKGEIVGLLPTSDSYPLNAVKNAAEFLQKHPEIAAVYGDAMIIDEKNSSSYLMVSNEYNYERLLRSWGWKDRLRIPGVAIFIRKKIMDEVGLFADMVANDYEYWLRIGAKHQFAYLPAILANQRLHDNSISGDHEKVCKEQPKISRRYWGNPFTLRYIRLWWSFRSHLSLRCYQDAREKYYAKDLNTARKKIILSLFNNPFTAFNREFLSLIIRSFVGDKTVNFLTFKKLK
ncbi:MAG: glycosyltransferase family 2 protein [bacterium]